MIHYLYLLYFLLTESKGDYQKLQKPTEDICLRNNLTMNDNNWRSVISFYKGCRNVGLAMEPPEPKVRRMAYMNFYELI